MGSLALVIEGIDDPATLQDVACREGIALAEDLNIQNIVIACDSKQVVFDINRGSKGRYGAIVSEIKLNSAHFILILFSRVVLLVAKHIG